MSESAKKMLRVIVEHYGLKAILESAAEFCLRESMLTCKKRSHTRRMLHIGAKIGKIVQEYWPDETTEGDPRQ